ncbi:MAG: AAA family ATPase [Paraclostridium sordellii]
MSYLSYLNIKKFRGISNLEIENLVNINIIVGDNNSGKTSLLESIAFLEKPDSIKNMLLNASRRDSNKISKFELFLEMFPKNQNNIRDIQIESIINNIKMN